MSKKFKVTITLVAIMGSVATFFATNMLMSDISNMFYMTITKDVISSIPWFIVSLQFVLTVMAMVRVEGRPQYKKARTKIYLNIGLVFAAIGIIFSVLTGTMIYHSFTLPYPYKFGVISVVIWHCLMLAIVLVLKTKVKTWPDDLAKRKLTIGRVFYTILASLMTFYALNRLGAIMLMSAYVHRASLNKTWIFYLSLLLPAAVLLNAIYDEMGEFKKHTKAFIVYNTCLLIADVALLIGVGLSAFDSQFVSVISPAVPIERLITIPIDTLLQHGSVFILAVYCLVKAIVLNRSNK
ncbi:MAG: hypothetical protein MJ150_03415 [Clostridia bacterium]|nr:hypothetical protein [Clostridia bacterium]